MYLFVFKKIVFIYYFMTDTPVITNRNSDSITFNHKVKARRTAATINKHSYCVSLIPRLKHGCHNKQIFRLCVCNSTVVARWARRIPSCALNRKMTRTTTALRTQSSANVFPLPSPMPLTSAASLPSPALDRISSSKTS